MTDKGLLKSLLEGNAKKLSAEEGSRLDGMLATNAQKAISELVKALPESSPSLQWRSQLNLALSEQLKRLETWRHINWVLRPTLGFAVVGALAALILWRQTSQVTVLPPEGTLEETLITKHQEAVNRHLVASYGAIYLTPTDTSGPWTDKDLQWEEADLGTL